MAIALGSLLAGAIYTWFVGEDVNWDWLNYHEYNVWAVINGRYGIDALPPGFQTYSIRPSISRFIICAICCRCPTA